MKGYTRRLCALAAGAAIAIIAVAAPAVGIDATAPPACTGTSGVTVIVDFTHFPGGEIERGCAAGHPATALDALHAAGFTTAGTAQYADAFLCRIDGLPTAAHEACAVTPSATAFWAFWHALPTDATWTYSAAGVTAYRPAAGSIEAFAFGNRALPGVSPSGAPPTTPTTMRGTVGSTRPPTTPAATGVPGATVPHPSTTASTAPTPPTSVPGSAPSTSAATAGSSAKTAPKPAPSTTGRSRLDRGSSTSIPRIVERAAARPGPHQSSGSPLPAILTVVVVGSLAAGAFAFSRARRRQPA